MLYFLDLIATWPPYQRVLQSHSHIATVEQHFLSTFSRTLIKQNKQLFLLRKMTFYINSQFRRSRSRENRLESSSSKKKRYKIFQKNDHFCLEMRSTVLKYCFLSQPSIWNAGLLENNLHKQMIKSTRNCPECLYLSANLIA